MSMRVSDVEVFAAGADNGLDELAIGIFVPALHQLRERLPTVGCLIIRAPEVERAHGIVRRTNREDAVEAEARLLDRV
ncbi:MAG: hypothetical protein ACRD26_14060, partial [Vicinamibacterales bacterium]